MRLHYIISFKEANLVVKIEEIGSRRILYWDTLSALAAIEDKEPILLFKKNLTRFSRNLETLSFNQVEIPASDAFKMMGLLSKTKRVLYNRSPLHCDWQTTAKIFWQGSKPQGSEPQLGELFSAWLQYHSQAIPLESCEKVFPEWCLWNGKAFPIQSPLPWKWIELFRKGPAVLEGVQKKRFLEEDPPIQWIKDEMSPRLLLTDATGCFANLAKENLEWEKDLLEVGYLRKTVGSSRYFCPGDQVRDALLLLLDVGWEVFLFDGKRLYRQTKIEWDLREADGVALVRGKALFQDKSAELRPTLEALKKGRLWVEIDGGCAGMLDRKKGATLEGEWVGDALALNRSRVAELSELLDVPEAVWEESLYQTVKGLKEGGGRKAANPGAGFCGELLPHQQKGLDWLWFLYLHGFSGLLADEMGLGKTVQVLAFFSGLRTNLPVLIIAPSSLLFHWKSEIRRFLPGASVALHSGSDRSSQIPSCQYLITSYALLRIDEELLAQTEWEVIVLDESNAIKTSTTKTAKAACRLKGRFRIALSGTPIENRAEEIESQFRFLMPGLIQNVQTELRKIKPFILRRKKDELSLPAKMEQISWIEMNEEQGKLYDSTVQALQTGLLKKVSLDGAAAHRMEILEAILRLRQISNDPRLVGQEIGGAKIERLLTDVEEALSEKRKVLIYSQFTSMLALIGKELRQPFLYLDGSVSPSDRADRVRRFQEDPDMPLFLLSLKAGGVGLNLTAADYVLLIDPWWNNAAENQAIDRAHRIGQKKTVIAKRYITPSTIEEKMCELKEAKQQIAATLLDSGEGAFSWSEEDLLHLLS